ncbi:hypothetical protein Achl_4176 (plasmid) [Pseudarthrobacter chlorophenolicus A6]|uniref:Uncharacterized protein n=1 Tax=Pseudarthrobacter chlorophenolicus (strain ATCC 700700 / DSM 12829 / CIP 107037 / JCM 12360 / KCTC 9906 / NCIMB 13794 / A6) TaxID=452863 RepID=B8HI80_PSECP|nr:hypothetical protein [Pseudarthrobacter chlorophenolicus]ACL42127.1 hypothetical protein Achl_4176 [Pseudarthrobacter chlorophenolicus A6]SDQ13790.1 hypothetical protein SAMN04489738_0235 [Pseudarthrobacter chlorophenolicus]
MTTLTTKTPLASYQQGRDQILATVLGAVSGLEGFVLAFQHEHEAQLRAAGIQLSDAVREQARLEGILGEQALELESARRHVCPTPPITDGFGFDQHAPAMESAPPAAAESPDATAQDSEDAAAANATIEELRASLREKERLNTSLNEDLLAERQVSAGLRADLVKRDTRITTLEADAAKAGAALASANQTHQDYVRDAETNFDQRLTQGVRSAEQGVRAEAVRIIEAIAADNPELAEAADLFTVAFPAVAEAASPAPQPLPAAVAEAPVPSAGPSVSSPAAPPVSEDDFLDAIPAAEPERAAAPMTQVYLPAPDLSDDSILDPDFFTTPEALDAPADEADSAPSLEGAAAEAPKPGYGLFGRKKEEQNA